MKRSDDEFMRKKNDFQRTILVLLGALLMALNIKVFVRAGDMFPGGFTGLTILIQRIAQEYFQVALPYTLINLLLNAVPAAISFKFIGKRFTLYSCLMIVVTSVMTDILPSMAVTSDPLLISVFGGIINACAICLCLSANATSGGTDFIAIFYSERKGVDTWNYVLLGNVIMLAVAGVLFGWEKSLYSIIFQFASTQVLHVLYKRYQKQTLLIITDHPEEVYEVIRDNTHHDATHFVGVGCYECQEKHLLYSVVSAEESGHTIEGIRAVDPKAFINCIGTDRITGRFYNSPHD